MDTWLRDMLITQGHMTSSGITRNARIHPCPRCKLPTIAGLDADIAARTAYCDLDQLIPHHEANALLEGRETYELAPRGSGRHILIHRDQWKVTKQATRPLIATHLCEQPLNPAWLTPETPDHPFQTTDPDHIPF